MIRLNLKKKVKSFNLYFMIITRAYLYIICAIHRNCPVLLIVYIWSHLPQLFGLVPLPMSSLCIW